MRKNHYTFTSTLIGCCLIALPFSGTGQQQGGPAVEFPDNQVVSTLDGGDESPRFMLMAPPAADLDQYRNGAFTTPINTCTNWVNGNAGEQNSHYIEGWSIPYRCVMTDLPLNTSITLTLGYDIKHSNKNALDYLTYFHRMSPHDDFCDANHNSPECVTPATGAFSTFAIPAPSSAGSPVPGMPTNSFNNLPAGEKLMRLYGGTITNIAYNTQGNLGDSDAETTINVTFTVTQATATLTWGGHIASRLDWGNGNSASGISGSPYHMRLKTWTLNNLGNTDRSLSAGAVGPPCVISGPNTVCANSGIKQYCVSNQTGITYNWTVSGGGATISGSNTGNCVNIQVGSGNYTVMVTLSNSSGFCSDCSMAVTVEPTGVCSIDGDDIICPGMTSHHCAPPGGTNWTWSITGGGTISGPTNQECVTFNAVNSCNSSYILSLSVGGPNCGSSCTKTVLVKDDTPPTIACPANIAVNCGASTLPANTGTATATDNCDLSPTITNSDNTISGSCGAATINRTWKAEDNCTKINTCLQVITINPAPKATFVNPPADITINCNQAPPTGTGLSYSNGGAGACD
ncbi:MAG TPA: hypothetical protein PK228_19195, partial [Saprospiraceae bacterium]|nr:hypothetical protein [Saprospiraceae bacterium]